MNVGIIDFGEMGKRHALEYYHATEGNVMLVRRAMSQTHAWNARLEGL
jgi:hypothetical protein